MKYFIGIIATTHLRNRIIPILSTEEIYNSRIVIESSEPDPNLCLPNEQHEKLWINYISSIKRQLYCNAFLCEHRSFPPDSLRSGLLTHSLIHPTWMNYRPLSKSEISVYYKHLKLLSLLIQTEYEYALILEDDCYLKPCYRKLVNKLFSEVSFDYLDLADGLNLHYQACHNTIRLAHFNSSVYPAPWPSTRTACAYLISKTMAMNIVNGQFRHYVLPYDFMLNYAMTLAKPRPRIYWCDTPFFIHGSKSGIYTPSVSAKA